MEPSEQTITSRRDKLNSQILGKTLEDQKVNLINRECLLDALQALYDECSIEALQKYDRQIAQFVERYKNAISDVKKLRVNVTDFEIKEVIGRGHFGEVHVVKEKQTGDIYAMKTIRKCDSLEKTSFDVERDIMAFSQSSWITSLQYAFQDPTYLFFVMEYHPGGDLLGLLYRQGTLPESAATFYLAEIILALEDLHKMGYVHRDIKPDNILLDRCGHLKLADFGSAARLNPQGTVNAGVPVGTPDYIAPEVLQSVEGKSRKGYGVSCDFWSLGILAFELTIGKPPFSAQNTSATYSRIINHANHLKFPSDLLLTQAYTNFVKSLVVDEKYRLTGKEIRQHVLFKNVHFDSLRDQVPPYVPKITSLDDTSNFGDLGAKKSCPSVENFKRKTQFSGRNLPFVGFTFVNGFSSCGREFNRESKAKDEMIRNMREELESVKRTLMKSEDFEELKFGLEKKILEKTHKLESIESVREKLERDLASSFAENTALKRTLEIERKDRAELERKALELIKSAKIKWETSERTKVESLKLEIEQQKEKITQLTTTNTMLNEQLKTAFRLENKHKESIEAVEQMNRRSLIGLESKLEKVAVESRQRMVNLQSSLDVTMEEKRNLEEEIRRLKDKEELLLQKLEKAHEEYSVLNGAALEAEKLVQELSEKVGNFEKEIDDCESLKLKMDQLATELKQKKEKIKDLDMSNLLLKQENKTIEEYKKQIETLKHHKTQSDKKINELESKLHEEEQKVASLQKQLEDSENLANETQQLKELRMKTWKMEKELSNAKIDKRILERELKEATKEAKDLTEEIKTAKTQIEENKKVHESAMLELNDINEKLSLELVKTKESLKSLQQTLENEKSRNSDEKILIHEMKEMLREKDSLISEASKETNTLKKEILSLKTEIKTLEKEKERKSEETKTCRRENQKLMEELNDSKRQIENHEMNLKALREACIIIENQVVEYENINTSIQAEKSKMAENTEQLIKDLCKAKEEIQDAKKLMNEEKSLKLLAETKVKRLNEDVESLQDELHAYKDQCLKYKECSNNLSDELALSEERVSDLEVTVKSYERQIEEFVSENNLLKEEVSQYLTQICALKESNFKSKQQIQELKELRNLLNERVQELENLLDVKINYYEEREHKNNSIIKQQTKLIDYLQVKIDEHNSKKRTLTDKLFGSSKKENQQPIALPINYKDLELQLQKQRQINKDLQEEVYKLKAELSCKSTLAKITRHRSEIASPKTKLAMEQLAKSPVSSKSELYKQNSMQRMYHNIPHRFVNKLSKKISKCDQCSNQIVLGREVCVCTECHMTVHHNCIESVKSTCGLPQAYAKHFKESITKLNSNKNSSEDSPTTIEGWIKVLSKNNTWEKRYATLTDSNLNIYSTSEKRSDALVEAIDLKLANSKKKIVLEPVPSELGVSVANSDLPFIMKVEIYTDCWPLVSFVFMALSLEDRDKWYKAIQNLLDDSEGKYHFEVVFPLPETINANCILDVTKNIKVLGTNQGLYSYHNDVLLHIEGLSEVHHISVIPESNMVVMIANLTSVLISCDLNHLINLTQCAPCIKPQLSYKTVDVKNLDGFHFLKTSSFGKHQMFCAANSKQLVIIRYDLENEEFVPLRIMDTAEPVGCALFTEHSLIVGADKFFEIELATFKAEEFLDASDIKLKHAIKCHRLRSFPLAIVEVGVNPKEYLLSFNEFSLFVDEYGRCSRDTELKTSYLPIGFNFIQSYLYIIQFCGVEIAKMNQGDFESWPKIYVDLKKMKYLGVGKTGVYVYHEGKVKLLEGRKLVECDDVSISQTTETEGSERFSFTSSMVQSLDENLSEEEDSTRRVKFQTDL